MDRIAFRKGLGPAVAGVLLALAAVAAALAFPRLRVVLGTPWANGVLLALLAALAVCAAVALWRRRWLSALFHAGAAAVVVGGGITAGHAESWQVALVDAPRDFTPPEYRRTVVDGDVAELESFTIETYPDGMPKQYRTRLRFPEGVRELWVNKPLRRKGVTYYQMSYSRATDPYGRQWWVTHLTLRRDPGAPVTFVGYGLLVAAALGLALREEARP